jgi:hypothetical protein
MTSRLTVSRITLASAVLATISFTSACDNTDPPTPTKTPSDSSKVLFVDVSEDAGLSEFRHVTGAFGEKWLPETMGSGLAIMDFDGDGWLDLMVASGGIWAESGQVNPPVVRLFKNDSGTFVESGVEVNVDEPGYSFGVTAADYDNDGDTDAFVTTLHRNLLLRNDGGEFTDVAQQAGLADDDLWSTAASFFDADRDGFLDLFVGGYVEWSPDNDLFCSIMGQDKTYCTPELYAGAGGRFFRNRGDGTFEDRTVEAGFRDTGKVLGSVELDFNDDGWPDLFVANDTDPDQLFENRQDGTFLEIGTQAGVAFDERGRARSGMGVDAGYIGPAEGVSIFVGNFSGQMIGTYRHIENGAFLDRAAVSKLGRPSLPTLTFGLFLVDANLDGYLDVFAANGHLQLDIERVRDNTTYRQLPHLFLNRGDETFSDVAPVSGFVEPLVGRGAARFDFDRDGDVDIVISENAGGLRLYRNDGDYNAHFMRVALEGTDSNRQGIGAVLSVFSGDMEQRRMITAGSSYLSTSEAVATFGVPGGEIDSLVIEWPSGYRAVFENPQVDGEYLALEHGELKLL